MKRVNFWIFVATLMMVTIKAQALGVNDTEFEGESSTSNDNAMQASGSSMSRFDFSDDVFTLNKEQIHLSKPMVNPMWTKAQNSAYHPELELHSMTTNAITSNYRQTWMRTNDGVKPYKVLDDITFVGVPLFLAGSIIKSDKAMFRVNDKENNENTQLLTDFKTHIDDYTQFFGPAMTVGLKIGGVEGRSDWGRLLASAGLSYGIMAAFVNGIKYSAKEMRPDGSTANSWPSGHTATSFVGATLLHKEYGLTRSPWFSVAGYGVATATGVMRVLNNRHWVSDVMSGAGIGIISTELGYALGDLIFKGKGLLRNDLIADFNNPSFFSISMGVGLGGKSIGYSINDFMDYLITNMKDPYFNITDDDDDIVADVIDDSDDMDDMENMDEWNEDMINIKFRAATVVDAEGAYFFNKYVGVGGRLRVRAMSAKSFGRFSELASEDASYAFLDCVGGLYPDNDDFIRNVMEKEVPIEEIGGIVKSDHMAEFSGSLGLYFNLPLGNNFSLGSKLLIGRSFTQELDIDGFAKGNMMDINYYLVNDNGVISPESIIDYPKKTGETYSTTWNYLTLGAKNSTTWGTGLSLTYRYKSNFAWRLNFDYDYTKKEFIMKYDPAYYLKEGLNKKTYQLVSMMSSNPLMMNCMELKKTKKMNYFTIGLSFMINI